MSSEAQGTEGTRIGRLRKAFEFATQRVQPSDELPEMPNEVGEWGRNTSLAMFAGICFLGARQWVRHRRLGPYRPQQPGLSKAQEAKLIAEENTKRLMRLSGEAIKGGVQFGSLAGLFYGVELLSSIATGEKTLADTVLAASVAGGVFGSFLPERKLIKVRSGVLGAALGACAAFPVGMLQIYVKSQLPKAALDEPDQKRQERYPELPGDPTEGVIRQLESCLKK